MIPVDTPEQLGRAAKAVRRAQRLRQDDLAAMVGVSHVTLMNIERGSGGAALGRVMDVLRELGVRIHLDVPLELAPHVEKAVRGERG